MTRVSIYFSKPNRSCHHTAILFVVFLVAVPLLSGCFGNKKKPALIVPPPSWVTSPPKDNSQYFFGVGEGRSVEASKISALKDVSSKLSVTVSGSSEISSSVRNDKFYESASVKVKSQIAKTKISNFDVLKTEQAGVNFYSLVRVSKQVLFDDLLQRLTDTDKRILNKVNILDTLSTLEQYAAWKEVEQIIPEATSLAFLAKSVNPAFELSKYTSRYNEYLSSSEKTLRSLNVYVSGDRQYYEIIKAITTALTDYGLKSSNTKTHKTNSSILVSGTERKARLYDSNVVNIRLTIQILDENGKVLLHRPVDISGSSSIDYKSARISAANNLTVKIKNEGVISFLGLDGITKK